MPTTLISEMLQGRTGKCIGSAYFDTYSAACPLIKTTQSGTSQGTAPAGTEWVVMTVRGGTLVINDDPTQGNASATNGHDFAVGLYVMDWNAAFLQTLSAYSSAGATVRISYYAVN